MLYIDHIGIAVKNIRESNEVYSRLLNASPYKEELVIAENVLTSFFRNGQTKIELVQSLDEHGAIARFIAKRGEGIHHIAWEVLDIHQEMRRLQEEGFQLIYDAPKRGADNKWVNFIHPKTANGVLTEICQSISAEDLKEEGE